MHWIAPTEKDAASTSLEKRLWDAADQFRANSGLKAQEYSGPIQGLISCQLLTQRPPSIPKSRLRGSKAEGIRFEKKFGARMPAGPCRGLKTIGSK